MAAELVTHLFLGYVLLDMAWVSCVCLARWHAQLASVRPGSSDLVLLGVRCSRELGGLAPLPGGSPAGDACGGQAPAAGAASLRARLVNRLPRAHFPGPLQVLVIPDAVPSLPGVILLHHFVTACLLCIPLRYPHLHR